MTTYDKSWNEFKEYKVDATSPDDTRPALTHSALDSTDIEVQIRHLIERKKDVIHLRANLTHVKKGFQEAYDRALRNLQSVNYQIEDSNKSYSLVDRELAELDGRKQEIIRGKVKQPKKPAPVSVHDAISVLKGLTKDQILQLLADTR